MAGVLLLLLLLPFALAIVAYFAFRFLAFNYGLRTLLVSGTVWVGAFFSGRLCRLWSANSLQAQKAITVVGLSLFLVHLRLHR